MALPLTGAKGGKFHAPIIHVVGFVEEKDGGLRKWSWPCAFILFAFLK